MSIQPLVRQTEVAFRPIRFKTKPGLIAEYADEITKALDAIEKWYDESNQSTANQLMTHLPTLVKVFPYVPYGGPYFRAFEAPSALIKKVVEGKAYKFKTGVRPIQSWTTSASNAVRFSQDQTDNENTLVIRLEKAKGFEILNQDYVRNVLLYIAKWENQLPEDLVELAESIYHEMYVSEDEVILKMPPTARVTVALILGARGRSYIRTTKK